MINTSYLYGYPVSPEFEEEYKKAVSKVVKELAESIRTGDYKKRPEPMTTEEFEKKLESMTNRIDGLCRTFEKICAGPAVKSSKMIH